MSLMLGLCVTARAQSQRLAWLGKEQDVARLSVAGAAAPNVNLEGSFDLQYWFHLASVAPNRGVATLAHTNQEPIDTWFYRAVEAPPPSPANAGAQLDPDLSVSAVITPESGGKLSLTNANGVSFHFSVRSNLVVEPVLVRMTVVSNFTSFPLENQFRAAVAFEPEGYEFPGRAELKIRFPAPIPEREMVGYAFDGAGNDFRPHDWEASAQEVTLGIHHFSGAGVVAQPFALSNNYLANENRAWNSTKSAIRLADQEAAVLKRQNNERFLNKEISVQEYLTRQEFIRLNRNTQVYSLGIRPLLDAAKQDCGVGMVVLERLDQLMREGETLVRGRELQRFKELAPAVRCQCAHKLIEECERNPQASGSSLDRQLTSLLQRIQIVTGKFDAQGCDLGDDNQLYERMENARCRLTWEGIVDYTRTRTGRNETTLPDGGFSREQNHDKLYYFGNLVALKSEEVMDIFGLRSESWVFHVDGHFSGERNDTVDGRLLPTCATITTKTRRTGGAFKVARPLEFYLDFLNGDFLAAELSPDSESPDPAFTTVITTLTSVACHCEPSACPKSGSKSSTGSDTMLFRVLPDADSPLVTTSYVGRDFVLTYKFKSTNAGTNEPQPGFIVKYENTEEIEFKARLRRVRR